MFNPVCSPSRTAAMAGHFPSRYSIHQHFADSAQNPARGMPDWLDPRALTVARVFQQAGYRTGHFGQWHLTRRPIPGAPDPKAYGFDEYAIFNGGAETPSAGLHDTPENTVRFIEANKDRPFYVDVRFHESHLPHVPTKAALAQWAHLDQQKRVYAAVITAGDNAVGRVLEALRTAGVEQNTCVLFSSDNGPESTGNDRGRERSTPSPASAVLAAIAASAARADCAGAGGVCSRASGACPSSCAGSGWHRCACSPFETCRHRTFPLLGGRRFVGAVASPPGYSCDKAPPSEAPPNFG